MKKIIASALGLALVGGVAVTTASAVESQFGGYWRTRMFVQSDFSGQDDASYNRTDNRTRLYYTAKFNDDFKFVNKFEFNSNWGDTNGGDIGADGSTWKVKNSYADFTLGNVNAKVGQQGATISRGFIFADDFSGVQITPTFGSVKVPFLYAMAVDDDVRGDTVGGDVHLASLMPSFQLDNFKLTPHVTYLNATSDLDASMAWIGLDVDAKFDAFSAWGSFIYSTGDEYDATFTGTGNDADGYLVAAGADAGIFHGQFFYASGEEQGSTGDSDAFSAAPGSSYYWSEIMGYGIFDNAASAGSPDDNITNIMALNVGVTLKPMDKLKLDFDVWYAALAEDNANGDDALGVEFDAKVTYALMDDLTAEFVVAYLMADDATVTAPETSNDEDAIEAGVRLSLKF
jgi:hypothetical protein